MDILFNNKLISQLIKVLEVNRDAYPSRSIKSIKVPNRNGVYFQGANFGERTITVKFALIQDYTPSDFGDSRFNQYVRSLTYYLTTDAPAKLVFSDEPTKFYWAIVTNVDVDRALRVGTGTITFECLDCFAYATEEKIYSKETNKDFYIENRGTAITYPKFNITFTKPTMSLALVTQDHIIQLGNPNDAFSGVTANNSRIHHDSINSLAKWYYGNPSLINDTGRVVDESVVMNCNGEVMFPTNLPTYTEDVGTGKYKGGFMMTNLDDTAKYFKVGLQFEMSSRTGGFNGDRNKQNATQQGMIEFIGYDVNNVVLFRLSMRDHWKTVTHNEMFWHVGNSHLVDKTGYLASSNTQTKSYRQIITSDDEIPEDAFITSDIQSPILKCVFTKKATVYASPSTSAKVITTVIAGTELLHRADSGNFWQVYLTDDKKQTGWVLKSTCTREDGGTQRIVTYNITTYGNSAGKFNDLWGRFELYRMKQGNGSTWRLDMKRIEYNTQAVSTIYSKTVTDYNDTWCTQGGALAKVGVFISCYEDAEPVGRMCLNGLEVDNYEIISGDDTAKYIAQGGDSITIDCGEHMIYKNGDDFMEYVDVGSDFIELQPFSNTECQVISDDENCIVSATVQERFI